MARSVWRTTQVLAWTDRGWLALRQLPLLRWDRRLRRGLAPVEALGPEDVPAHQTGVVPHPAAESEVPAPR